MDNITSVLNYAESVFITVVIFTTTYILLTVSNAEKNVKKSAISEKFERFKREKIYRQSMAYIAVAFYIFAIARIIDYLGKSAQFSSYFYFLFSLIALFYSFRIVYTLKYTKSK